MTIDIPYLCLCFRVRYFQNYTVHSIWLIFCRKNEMFIAVKLITFCDYFAVSVIFRLKACTCGVRAAPTGDISGTYRSGLKHRPNAPQAAGTPASTPDLREELCRDVTLSAFRGRLIIEVIPPGRYIGKD